MDEVLIVFGKPARAGSVKTRLCPPLKEEMAARLYRAFAKDTFEMAGRYREVRKDESNTTPTLILAWPGTTTDPLAAYASETLGFELMEQGTGDLGQRLRRVTGECRRRGASSIMVVGTDAPTLSVEHLETARLVGTRCDVVFGPAFDGGYYLVAFGERASDEARPEAGIFEDIDWSTDAVLEQSWRRATQRGLLCELLGYWYDIDTFEDLKRAQFHLFEYLASRDPLVGQHTRSFLESRSIPGLGNQ